MESKKKNNIGLNEKDKKILMDYSRIPVDSESRPQNVIDKSILNDKYPKSTPFTGN